MPAYLTHAIMGNTIYNNAKSDNKLFKINIPLPTLKASTLSPDLAKLSKSNFNSHNKDTDLYFFNMIEYIKENKLYNDLDVMSLLYGNISHYFLDVYTHPLIYYISENCVSLNKLNSHILTEGYISSYMSEKEQHTDYMNLKSNYIGSLNFANPNLKNLIRETYYKTYNDLTILKSYKTTFELIKLIEKLTKENRFTSKEKLIKLSKFKEYLEINNLSKEDLTNEQKEYWINPVTNEKYNESFIELYNKALTKTYEAIYHVNKYLYDTESKYNLYKIFTNLSYDTGVSCNLGKNLIYVKKKSIK
ncbi:MAG: zinc dependent phospholipase C family protein [Bacilli bacterium]|nr:zinc dependent phospholipase C family protein [Bacilli bacterium]